MGEPVRLSKEDLEKLVQEIDNLTLNPSKRGAKLFEALQKAQSSKGDLDSYDLLCFSITSLPGLLVEQMSFDPKLAASIKYLSIWLSNAHYQGRLWDIASQGQVSTKLDHT